MTWKISRHGPCECTQSDRLPLLVVVGLCRQTWEPSEGLHYKTKFTIALAVWLKQSKMDMKQVNRTIKSDDIIYEVTLKCLAMVI